MTDSPLRVWPAVVIVLLQWIASYSGKYIAPGSTLQFFGMIGGPLLGTIFLLSWWGFASRAGRREKWIGLGAFLGSFALVWPFAHSTMQMVLVTHALPGLCLAFVGWAVLSRTTPVATRTPRMFAVLLVASLGWALLRMDGVTGTRASFGCR